MNRWLNSNMKIFCVACDFDSTRLHSMSDLVSIPIVPQGSTNHLHYVELHVLAGGQPSFQIAERCQLNETR